VADTTANWMRKIEAGTEDTALRFIEPVDVAQVMGNRVTGTEPRIYVIAAQKKEYLVEGRRVLPRSDSSNTTDS
jgi:hypothetical protein